MLRLWQWLVAGVVCVLLSWGYAHRVLVAHAALDRTQRVLVVYDREDPQHGGRTKIATMQRLLASVGVPSQTEALAAYHAGQLTGDKYQGVVTLVNTPNDPVKNAAFFRDRARFTGRKLHVGQGLSAQEATQLNATRRLLDHQQVTLRAGSTWQLLPFKSVITLLQPTGPQTKIGTLRASGGGGATYAYGTVVDQAGYLPELLTTGVAMTCAMRTVATLFDQVADHAPLLTITGVTPYSDLARLRQLSRWLKAAGIPFAVSTTTVSRNTGLQGFATFTKTLREVETSGGVIFLRVPTGAVARTSSGPALEHEMVAQLNQLGQRQVIPVGLSAPGTWNQDAVLRSAGLQRAQNVLFLPDEEETLTRHADNLGATYGQSWFALQLDQLQTPQTGQGTPTTFAVPTAVTVPFPQSTRQLTAQLRRLQDLQVTWYAPQRELTAELTSASATFAYRRGTYQLNGQTVAVSTTNAGIPNYHFTRPTQVTMQNYFKYQGWVLLTFFSLTTVVLVGFLVVGRRLYRRKFFRQDKQ